jgi:hypothetical protein
VACICRCPLALSGLQSARCFVGCFVKCDSDSAHTCIYICNTFPKRVLPLHNRRLTAEWHHPNQDRNKHTNSGNLIRPQQVTVILAKTKNVTVLAEPGMLCDVVVFVGRLTFLPRASNCLLGCRKKSCSARLGFSALRVCLTEYDLTQVGYLLSKFETGGATDYGFQL